MILLSIKVAIEYFELDLIAVSPLVTAFAGGLIFIIVILLAGTLSDYNSDLATSILALCKDIRIACTDDMETIRMQERIRAFLSVINANFRNNIWKQKWVNSVMDKIDGDILCLARSGTTIHRKIKE